MAMAKRRLVTENNISVLSFDFDVVGTNNYKQKQEEVQEEQ